MKCPECKEEMGKDIGGLSSFGGDGQAAIAIQFNTHVCDCRGTHKALMDDGFDLVQYWRDHPHMPPPNHKQVAQPSEEHRQESLKRQQAGSGRTT